MHDTSWDRRFAQALRGREPGDDRALLGLTLQPGFAVYRNTVHKGCIDALEGNFPTVVTLVGRDWFRSAAAAFAALHWPTDPVLLRYGDAGFADFLQALPTAAGLPYLGGVAQLDVLWRQAHCAADAPVLTADGLAVLDTQTLPDVVLRPHPAARWAWFGEAACLHIWQHTRAGVPVGTLPSMADGALLTRPGAEVEHAALPAAGVAFLDACAAGQSLGEAAACALARDPEADIASLFALLLGSGALDARSLDEVKG